MTLLSQLEFIRTKSYYLFICYYYLFVLLIIVNILAVPKNTIFYITPTLFAICSFSIHPSNSFVTLPRALITARTTCTNFSLYNIPMSLFQSSYFSTFFFFYPTLTLAGTTVSMIILFRSFLSIKIMSGLLASITLPNWLLISDNIFTSSFSTALSRTCSYHNSVRSNPFFLQ